MPEPTDPHDRIERELARRRRQEFDDTIRDAPKLSISPPPISKPEPVNLAPTEEEADRERARVLERIKVEETKRPENSTRLVGIDAGTRKWILGVLALLGFGGAGAGGAMVGKQTSETPPQASSALTDVLEKRIAAAEQLAAVADGRSRENARKQRKQAEWLCAYLRMFEQVGCMVADDPTEPSILALGPAPLGSDRPVVIRPPSVIIATPVPAPPKE